MQRGKDMSFWLGNIRSLLQCASRLLSTTKYNGMQHHALQRSMQASRSTFIRPIVLLSSPSCLCSASATPFDCAAGCAP